MSKTSLSEARVERLTPRRSAYDIRDAKLRCFGVRVLPSGAKRYFIHAQHRGERSWEIVGDANSMSLKEARARAASMLTTVRGGEDSSNRPGGTVFEAVAEAVFERYAKVWKPRTLEVNRTYLRRQLLPWFAGRQIADIVRRDVQRWFASLRTTPVAADRSAPVLSVIMKEAELLGYRPAGSNPVRGIRRYRRKGRERFLSEEELRRLARCLSVRETGQSLQVAAVRLLLLTGCRCSEVLTLRWSDYREGHLHLRDSKTGPRTVWLSGAARRVLERIERTSRWVFPTHTGTGPRDRRWLGTFWEQLRAEADLSDVRLHDLRHSFASHAVMNGVPVPVVARLLGHANVKMTLRCAHLADKEIEAAAERVGAAIAQVISIDLLEPDT